MPYIKSEDKEKIDKKINKLIKKLNEEFKDDVYKRQGALNYIISKIIWGLVKENLRYTKINDVVGALECCKLEFYRRIAAPYEDEKMNENGDVFNKYDNIVNDSDDLDVITSKDIDD